MKELVLVLALLLSLSLVAGCGGGGGGGNKPPATVSGVASLSSQTLHPMVMIATKDEAVISGYKVVGVTYCKISPIVGSDYGKSAFKLELPSSSVPGIRYRIVIFNDTDGNGVYAAIDGRGEFIGDWNYFLVSDGAKWHVEDKDAVIPPWGADATSKTAAANIVVNGLYLK